jgi:hypothetical protein
MKLKEAGTPSRTVVAEVSLVELSTNGVTFAWPEAVALISQICRCLIASGTQDINPSTILIQSTGDVNVRGSTSGEAEHSVQMVGALLRTCLAGTSHPVPLQMLVAQATCTPPFYRSIAELAEALAYYSSSNPQELTRAVYERWRNDRPAPVRVHPQVRRIIDTFSAACLRKFITRSRAAWARLFALVRRYAARPKWITQRILVTQRALSLTTVILFCIGFCVGIAGFAFAAGVGRSPARAFVAKISLANGQASAALASTVSGAVELVRSRLRRTAATPENSAIDSRVSRPAPRRLSTRAASRTSAALETPAERSDLVGIEDVATSQRSAPADDRIEPLAAVPPSQLAETATVPRHPPDLPERNELRVYSAEDTDVTPPTAIDRVSLNEPLARNGQQDAAAITIVVGEDGRVESATLARRPATFKDTVAATMNLSAVKTWRFHPAQQAGRPVKYRTTVWLINR